MKCPAYGKITKTPASRERDRQKEAKSLPDIGVVQSTSSAELCLITLAAASRNTHS
jgi:hypothetical protein